MGKLEGMTDQQHAMLDECFDYADHRATTGTLQAEKLFNLRIAFIGISSKRTQFRNRMCRTHDSCP
jgi:hypothetical protein